MFSKIFDWLFGGDKKEEPAKTEAWPFPTAEEVEKKAESKPKAKKATTKKAPAKPKAKAPAKPKAKAKPKAGTKKTSK